jgi:uncharacterized damage-inducible protein DinB
MQRFVISSVEGEYRRYKKLAEEAFRQLPAEDLARALGEGGNSVAILVWHISGNLESRFRDFLTTDGEKPARNREEEFAPRRVTLQELEEKWNRGWSVLFDSLTALDDSQLEQSVTIRGVALRVIEALHRSLAHAASHAGQIVLIARTLRGSEWTYLSIPPGGSSEYNASPKLEKPPS